MVLWNMLPKICLFHTEQWFFNLFNLLQNFSIPLPHMKVSQLCLIISKNLGCLSHISWNLKLALLLNCLKLALWRRGQWSKVLLRRWIKLLLLNLSSQNLLSTLSSLLIFSSLVQVYCWPMKPISWRSLSTTLLEFFASPLPLIKVVFLSPEVKVALKSPARAHGLSPGSEELIAFQRSLVCPGFDLA